MNNLKYSKKKILIKTYTRILLEAIFLLAVFLLTAGTWKYWQAYLYCALLCICILCAITFWFRDSAILERRTRSGEKEKGQRFILAILVPIAFLLLLIPGFDQRWGWSHVPPAIVIVGDILMLLGYGIMVATGRANPYLSGVIEVEANQMVVSSGPYAVIRHPMYSGLLMMILFTPLGLGSYWAIIPAILTVPLLMARIVQEEKTLVTDLKGYMQYMQKTKYRLIPGIW